MESGRILAELRRPLRSPSSAPHGRPAERRRTLLWLPSAAALLRRLRHPRKVNSNFSFHSPFGPRPRALWSWLNFRFISDRDLWKIRLEAEELQPTRLGFVGWAGRSNRLYAIYRNRYLTLAICFCNERRNYFKILIWKPPFFSSFFPFVAQHFWATPGSFGLVMPPAGADGNYEVQTTTSFLIESRNKTFSVPDYPIGHIQVSVFVVLFVLVFSTTFWFVHLFVLTSNRFFFFSFYFLQKEWHAGETLCGRTMAAIG